MKAILRITALTVLLVSSSSFAFEPDSSDKLQLSVAKAIIDVKEADPGIAQFFENSAGYAVFPNVGKGGIGVGGAHGKGLVIQNDQVIGKTSLSQLTVGLQLANLEE